MMASLVHAKRLLLSNQMETYKDIEAKEQPHLSGAYIRSLVKHLTSKDSSDGSDQNGECFHDVSSSSQKQPPQPQHKKQVRRRLHTTKPYQERLLNMAEARREIVTALKFHRASMKQQQQAAAATSNRHQSQSFGQEKLPKSRPIHTFYPPTAATTTTAHSYWPVSTYAPTPPLPPPPSYHDNQNIILPSQTLGLSLNFQSFSNLDTNIYHKPLSVHSPSSTSSSTAPAGNSTSTDLHHAMDGGEMEEIRSLGEQHQIEWKDTINLVTSARWCSFLKTMEVEANDGDEYDGFHQFDQVMDFPPWLINANESSGLQQHFDDHYFQDPALPCMDIGEIEAMDGEWLA
ncbi:hypothetical protein L1987_54584 [Smallanthus sonchifolius]|uniref:Uncharacterized protein n=1 Tax=Smallanthus sonchifolius TaxID=185202 RepID=A0ACB9E720_9ASTR|nr:hypothetical protein L1987_54584 [Smallanthus sonchifolius]